MDFVTSLKKRIFDNEASIASLKDKLAALEMEQHKLTIALEVVAALDARTPLPTPAPGSLSAPRRRLILKRQTETDPLAHASTKQSVKDLILKTLEEAAFPLTRMDVVSRLSASGHNLNAATIGSTLSRLVDVGLIEKASHSQYRIRAATPVGAGPSE